MFRKGSYVEKNNKAPVLRVTPKEEHLWGQRGPRVRGGENTFIPLIPAACCLCPPQKNNLGVPMPPCTQTSSKTKAFSCCSSRRPLPVKDGRTDGVFVPGGVAAWLLSAGAAGSAMQPLREAAR